MEKLAEDFIGTKQKISGHVFNVKKELPEQEYSVLNAKQVPYACININTLEETQFYAVSLLLKCKGMKRSKWSRKIPLREL